MACTCRHVGRRECDLLLPNHHCTVPSDVLLLALEDHLTLESFHDCRKEDPFAVQDVLGHMCTVDIKFTCEMA